MKKAGPKHRARRMDRKLAKPDQKHQVTLTESRSGQVLFSGTDAQFEKAAHRVTTTKSNGSRPESTEVAPGLIPIGEAMRRAVEALGDRTIDADLAAQQMCELAECYERVTEEQAAYFQKSETAKIAKKALESATNLLLDKVRTFTHATPLPLFDQPQAEADRAAMVADA